MTNDHAKQQEQAVDQQQVLKDLLALGKKNGRLSLKEIADALGQLELESEDIDKLYETLENMGIEVETADVLEKTLSDDDSFEPENVEEVPEEELVDTSAMAETFAIDDPVRMYLKEIGKVDLLSPEEESRRSRQDMHARQRRRRAHRKRRPAMPSRRRNAPSWIRTSRRATAPRSAWPRPTCVWSFRSRSATSAAACCSSTSFRRAISV